MPRFPPVFRAYNIMFNVMQYYFYTGGTPEPLCKEAYDGCKTYTENSDACENNYDFMKLFCEKSCGFCGNIFLLIFLYRKSINPSSIHLSHRIHPSIHPITCNLCCCTYLMCDHVSVARISRMTRLSEPARVGGLSFPM